ncbi:response regulator transcription factor [Vibrio sp. DW001]|uniref:helix-turn-helix transcriptional regulator n=1 Tax=Vibrio sp. DW001 TaxID=2912315 RepID=UPI0023AE8612|nr:response regulator transcription factor [Vibrio sp. DW001]WED29791.1 response regulator transcription factor [Vibrio sp. DW001]
MNKTNSYALHPKKNILFFGRRNIQSSLIKKELESATNIQVTQFSHNSVVNSFTSNKIDVVLIGYHSISDSAYSEFMSSSTPGLSVVIYDVPTDLKNETELMSWNSLRGILYEDAPIEHLVRCVVDVIDGELWLPRQLMSKMLLQFKMLSISSPTYADDLTKREKEILDMLVRGQTNLQIADQLYVAECTVKTHIYKIYKKLNIKCRKEAITLVNRCNSLY